MKTYLTASASMLALCAGAMAPTWAAAQASGPSEPAAVEAVVITGSRLQPTGFESPQPVTVVGAEEIQRRAAVNIAQVLNDIPAFRPTSTNVTGNFASGGAGSNFADLRGLGTTRTLVLVDGRRFVPSALTGQVNLNLIPTMMIQRVETVTGGASAAYGSDAVAGVVNLILKKDVKGIEISAQTGVSQRSDDKEYRIGVIGGTAFAGGRGHMTAGLDYVKNDGVGDIYTRDWGQLESSVLVNPTPGANGLPARIITAGAHFSNMARGGIITAGPLAGTAFGSGGVSYPWKYGLVLGSSQIGGDGYGVTNYTYQPISPPVERFAGLVRGEYEITDRIRLNAELSHGQTQSRTINGPSRDQANLTIRPDNAFIPADIRARRNALGIGTTNFTMGRYEDDVHLITPESETKTSRAIVGLEGDITETWSWDASYQYGRSDFALRQYGNRITANWLNAIDAVANPANGQIVCRSTLTSPSNGCVPLNIFGYGSPSQAARTYVTGTGVYDLEYTQQAVAANLRGELFNVPAGAVSLAVGAEYRKERADATSDPLSQANAFQIGNPKPFHGGVEVSEFYGEVAAPILRDLPLIQALDLNAAVRRTDYSSSGVVTTWKAGLSWTVTDELRLRGTRSRDIRAPNLSELYSPTTTGQTPIINPYTNIQSFVVTQTGGNPDLKAEFGDTWTGGAVYQPAWASGLRTSVDYYSIRLKDAVSNVAGQALVTGCASGRQDYCSLVTFDANRNLTLVKVLSLNLASLETRGFDVEVAYKFGLSSLWSSGAGDLSLRLLGSYVADLITTDSGGSIDRAGAFGNHQAPLGVPCYTVNAIVNYDWRALSLSGQVRYLPSGKFDATLVGPQDAGYSVTRANSINDNRVPAMWYLNLSGQYDFADNGGPNVVLFGGINNVLDQDPPVSPTLNSTNPVNTTFYDVIGRTYRLGVRYKF